MHISDLIAFRRAEASGHIVYNYENKANHCPSVVECTSCTFYHQCDDNSYFIDDEDDTYIDGWVRAFKVLPEYALTLDELQTQYPEYFI
jgi:hypothetical protein